MRLTPGEQLEEAIQYYKKAVEGGIGVRALQLTAACRPERAQLHGEAHVCTSRCRASEGGEARQGRYLRIVVTMHRACTCSSRTG